MGSHLLNRELSKTIGCGEENYPLPEMSHFIGSHTHAHLCYLRARTHTHTCNNIRKRGYQLENGKNVRGVLREGLEGK